MLKVTSAEKTCIKLKSGELMHYFSLPRGNFDKLKADFSVAKHLATINELNLKGVNGVLVKCHHLQDGHLAALYIIKKYLEENMPEEPIFDEDEDEFPMDTDDEYEDGVEELTNEELIQSVLYEENELANVPVITANELLYSIWNLKERSIGLGPYNVGWESEAKNREAYWINETFPLIVEGFDVVEMNAKEGLEFLEQSNRFYIYIRALKNNPFQPTETELNSADKTILFELNMEYCLLDKPEMDYYEKLFQVVAKANGYKISRALDRRQLVKELIDYRGYDFRSSLDIEILVKKAIRNKGGKPAVLKRSDFELLFIKNTFRTKGKNRPSRAAEELDQLIGMNDVKQQLKRLVARLKFIKLRKHAGFVSSPTHAAAVFLGSPGTAKTTVARILGKMLREEQVLTSDVFLEISRKDIIGKYLGHTAPLVASIFEKARGGTIFIDEAYSLLSHGSGDIYSDEALSEIIRQMENNPETLVIFAGYEQEMKQFIKDANPGLRSRLTNVIEFKDYNEKELIHIFAHFVSSEEFQLENFAACEKAIAKGLNELKQLRTDNLGNGRLMRKLFNTAVSYMAEREDNDLKTIKTSDIEKAVQEVLSTERLVSHDRGERVGFVL